MPAPMIPKRTTWGATKQSAQAGDEFDWLSGGPLTSHLHGIHDH
jgi:hypothetical protein